MATKKVTKSVDFPLDQIGYETIYKFITNIDELAEVLEKAVYSKDSFEKFRKSFFEAYENIKHNLVVYRDRLGNILTKEQLSREIPNSWVAIAKEKGVTRLDLPRNEYDDKLDKIKQDEKEGVWRTYYGDWGTTDEEMDEIVSKVEPKIEETEQCSLSDSDMIIETPWYKKLWNFVRRAK